MPVRDNRERRREGKGDESRRRRLHRKAFQRRPAARRDQCRVDATSGGEPPSQETGAAERIARLSLREHQVLDAYVAGRVTKQIAYDLSISVRTVEVHRTRMLERLRTRSLAEAVRMAVLAAFAPVDLEARAARLQPRGGASRCLRRS